MCSTLAESQSSDIFSKNVSFRAYIQVLGLSLDQQIPWEVIVSLEFLVAFKSNFLKFLQTQRQASPLSVIVHSHNSSSLKEGCKTFNKKYHRKVPKCQIISCKMQTTDCRAGKNANWGAGYRLFKYIDQVISIIEGRAEGKQDYSG